jgi:DNA-binding winged helix-turn-helix (wHTH) protein/Tfp pilus assembly protein PilF
MDYEVLWSFGEFSFGSSDYRLRTKDSVQTLAPKQAELLLIFLENASRVLSRNELHLHLWPKTHVGRTNLGVHIAGLRRALGDNANSPEFIETVSPRGFRFLPKAQCRKKRFASADVEPHGNIALTRSVRRHSQAVDELQKAATNTRATRGIDEAYRLYAQGRLAWKRRTSRDLRLAIGFYEEAINLAPSFPLPYVGMADAYNYLSMHPGSGGTSYLSLRKAKVCSYKAIRLNPNSAPAWAALGHAQFTCDWEVNAAEDSYRTAIDLDPGYAPAHQWFAWLLLAMGRRTESEREIKYAYHLDEAEPSSKVAFGLHLHYLGQHTLALEQFWAALKVNPQFTPAYREIGRVFEARGQYADAIQIYMQARAHSKLDAEMNAVLAHAMTQTDGKKKAAQILASLLLNRAQKTLPLYEVAVVLSGLGRVEEAIEMLRTAWEQRRIWPIWLLFDSRLEKLRMREGFKNIVSRFVGSERTT